MIAASDTPVSIVHLGELVRARALQRQARSSSAAPRMRRIAIVLAILINILVVLGLREAMQIEPIDDGHSIQVDFYPVAPIEPPLPEPPLLQRATLPVEASSSAAPGSTLGKQASLSHISPPSPPAPGISSMPQSAAPTPIRIFNKDGSLAIPSDLAAQLDPRTPSDIVSRSTVPSPIMLPRRLLKMRPNYFANMWRSPSGSPLNDFVDDHLSTSIKEFTMPWGSKVKCKAVTVFVLSMGACGWGFPPPPGGHPTEPWKPATALDEY